MERDLNIVSLFEDYWLTKKKNPNEYNRLSKLLGSGSKGSLELKKFIRESLGMEYTKTGDTIKIVKRPIKAYEWMGIKNFKNEIDYALFSLILGYLIESTEEQFTFREMKEFIDRHPLKYIKFDWTKNSHKRSILRALEQLEIFGLIEFIDGNIVADFIHGDANFDSGIALYNNNGIARDFLPNFDSKVLSYYSIEDFEDGSLGFMSGEYEEMDFAKSSVMKHISLTPSFHISEDEKAYKKIESRDRLSTKIQTEVNKYLRREVSFTSGNITSYSIKDEIRRKTAYWANSQIQKIVLEVNRKLRELVKSYDENNDELLFDIESESITLMKREFKEIVKSVIEESSDKWTDEFINKLDEEIYEDVLIEMEEWKFLDIYGSEIVIRPLVYKLTGAIDCNDKKPINDENSDSEFISTEENNSEFQLMLEI